MPRYRIYSSAILALTLLVGSPLAQAVTLFFDTFDGNGIGFNLTGISGWNVTSGNIDVIGTTAVDLYPGNGNYLDLAGNQNGAIETSSLLNLFAGDYALSFELGSNLTGNTLNYSVGSLLVGSISATSSLLPQTFLFTVTTPILARIKFEEVGTNDAGGSVLNDVLLVGTAAVVPVPAAVWLFGSGLIGLIGVVRRKRA